MNFLLKICILALSFHVAFGKTFYQKQQDKIREQQQDVLKVERATRKFCAVSDNYHVEKCTKLRLVDSENEEARKIEKEKKNRRKIYCESRTLDFLCIHEFGFPGVWNWVSNFFGMMLLVPLFSIFFIAFK
jgi:hypothetical protein